MYLCVCVCVFAFVCVRGSLFVEKQYLMRFFLTCPYTTTPSNITNCSELILATTYYILSKTVHVHILFVFKSSSAKLVGCTCGRSAAGRRHMWVGVLLLLLSGKDAVCFLYLTHAFLRQIRHLFFKILSIHISATSYSKFILNTAH